MAIGEGARRLPQSLPGWPVVAIALALFLSPLLSGAVDYQIDPARAWVHHSGRWASWCLVLTLAMTPLQRYTRWAGWIRWRRVFGLLTFTGVCIHLLLFVGAWQGFDPVRLSVETAKRPYLWLGLVAWLMLLPLAVTSTRAAQRRLGPRWKRLHRLVYPLAVLALWHQAWANKIGLPGVWQVAACLVALLAWRVFQGYSRKKASVGSNLQKSC